MKKWLRFLLVLAILLAAAHGCLAEEAVEWTAVDFDKSPFLYSDDLLMMNEHELNPDIAKISMALSAAAYDEPTVRDVLQQMGFEPLVSGYYTEAEGWENMNQVGYTIARKTSGDYTIYCVPVRGTRGDNELLSDLNITLTSEGYTAGFGLPAMDVWEDLMELVETDGTTSDKRIFLLTGHSRGGAVANIVAGKLMKEHLGRVFGYNFACPNVFYGSADVYNNIHNFNFSNDLVPRLPLENWGFTRYGMDHFTDAAVIENVFMQKTDMDIIMAVLGALDVKDYNKIRLVTTLMSWSVVDGDADLLRELLSQFMDDTEGLIYLISDGRGLGADCSLVQMEYTDMLSFWDENRYTMSTIADESWMDFRSRDEYTAVFTLYDQTAGQTINSYAELEALIPTLRQRYTAINDLASIEDVLDQLFEGKWKLKDVFKSPLKAHNNGYYVQWMNRDYYGYEGKKGQNYENICLNLDVRTIGSHCFDGATGSFEVNLNGVDAIAREAFENCDGLTAVEISYEQDYVGYHAFSNCDKLADVTLPADYGYNYFFSGSKVETLTYTPGKTGVMIDAVQESTSPTWYTSLDWPTLDARNTLKHIIFEEGITHISDYLCSNPGYIDASSTALESITLPSTLRSIGKYSFEGCSSLTTVNFSDAAVLESIGEHGFEGCSALQGMTLPDSLSSMGQACFQSCASLTQVNIPSSLAVIPDYAFRRCTSLPEVTIPDTVKSVGSSAFGNCTGLKKLTIAAEVSTDGSFSGSSVETIVYTPGKTGVMIDAVQESTSPTRYTSLDWPTLDARNTLKQIIFEEGITHISDYLCSNPGNNDVSSTNLESITLPSTLRSIGKYSFEGCSSLTTVNFSDDAVLESIGEHGFEGCSALQGMTLPDSLSSMGQACFQSCASLTQFNIPSSLAVIPDYAFRRCTSLPEVTIPDTVKSVGSSAFDNCTGLKKLTIAAEVSTDGSFSGSSVETIVYTPGKTGVMIDAVQESTSPTRYTSLDWPTLDARNTLKQIIFEEGITHISDYLCSHPGSVDASCTTLESIILPSTLKSIGKYSFDGCTSLVSVALPEGLTSVGSYAFNECTKLIDITFLQPSDAELAIGGKAFQLWSWTNTTIRVPDAANIHPAISGYRWSGSYRNVAYADFDSSFRIVMRGGTISANTPIALYAINLPEGCFMSDVAWSVNDERVAQITQDGSLNFSRAGFATISAEIPQKGVKCELTLECEGTSVIRLPGMLRLVEAEAFEGLTAEIVVIPSGVERVENRAFANCPNLYKIIVENPETVLEEGAFEGSDFVNILAP